MEFKLRYLAPRAISGPPPPLPSPRFFLCRALFPFSYRKPPSPPKFSPSRAVRSLAALLLKLESIQSSHHGGQVPHQTSKTKIKIPRPPKTPQPAAAAAAAAADTTNGAPSAPSGAITNPMAPTSAEVTFLLTLLANLKANPDVDWDALAPALGTTKKSAQDRWRRLRHKFRLGLGQPAGHDAAPAAPAAAGEVAPAAAAAASSSATSSAAAAAPASSLAKRTRIVLVNKPAASAAPTSPASTAIAAASPASSLGKRTRIPPANRPPRRAAPVLVPSPSPRLVAPGWSSGEDGENDEEEEQERDLRPRKVRFVLSRRRGGECSGKDRREEEEEKEKHELPPRKMIKLVLRGRGGERGGKGPVGSSLGSVPERAVEE